MRHIVFLVILSLIVLTSTIFSSGILTEYSNNPVFKPVQGQQAKNPCVVYDQSGFESANLAASYKMWFATEDGIALAYSNDGFIWTEYNYSQPLSGLQAAADLPYVIYDKNGFGGTNYYYRIWYWSGVSDSIEGIRTAESIDGIVWENDRPIQQHSNDESLQLVTNPGVYDGYFHYCYGPGSVLYNPKGTDIGSSTPADKSDDQPMTYRYIMYYNSSSEGLSLEGSIMQTSLAYSVDGKYWIRYGDKPVIIPSGNSDVWDGFNRFNARVVQNNNKYFMWYSGSANLSISTPPTGRIGSGSSPNGIDWNFNLKIKMNTKSYSELNIKESRGHSIIPKSTSNGKKYGIWTSVLNNINNYSINYYEITAIEPPGGEYRGINIDNTSGYAPFTFAVWINKVDWSGSMSCYLDEMYWKWTFGDGTTEEGYDAWALSHTYERAGSYTITATNLCEKVWDIGSDTQVVQALNPPFPCFTVQPESGFAPVTITFDSSCTQLPANVSIVSYSWDFGDGTIGNASIINHIFTDPGAYIVSLEIVTSESKKYSFASTVTIKGLYAPSNITLEREINRSLFKATAQNLLKWSSNPQIYGCAVVSYNIYRKLSSQPDSEYSIIGSVNGSTFEFTDKDITLNERYSYVLTAVESKGHESAFSAPVVE